jgi:dolichol-phosphate mannosyltransferase
VPQQDLANASSLDWQPMENATSHAIVAAVIPCFKVKAHIADVIAAMPQSVTWIVCVDDCCPDGSGDLIATIAEQNKRVILVRHSQNQGVGGAMLTGYRAALERGADILVKMDGDGQMDAALLPLFVQPIAAAQADYTKGNRFYSPESLRQMPGMRLFGNGILSFMSKLSTGYWNIFDPTNGYTAIHARIVEQLPHDKIAKRYFFETDMLYHLNTIRAVVTDIPMDAKYGDEESGLKIGRILGPFLRGHMRNIWRRFFYNYILRDFSMATVATLLGLPLLVFGIGFGIERWLHSLMTGVAASAGTVMLSALPIITGIQLLLIAMNIDVSNVPRLAVFPHYALRARIRATSKVAEGQ